MRTGRLLLLTAVIATGAVTTIGGWWVKSRPRADISATSVSGVSILDEPIRPAKNNYASRLAQQRTFARGPNYARLELATTVAKWQLVTEPDEQSLLLSELIDRLAALDTAEAIEFLNAQEPSEMLLELGTLFMRRLAEKNPGSAAQMALQLKEPNRTNALNGVAIGWANQQLDEAIAWAKELPDGESKRSIQRSIAYEAARSDPMKAINLVASQPSSSARDLVLIQSVAQWATTDPAAAANWAFQIEEPSLKYGVIGMVATTLAQTNPIAASNLALQSLPAGKIMDDAITSIVQRWTQIDPKAAAEWVTRFPNGDLRNAAIANLVKLWVDQNPEPAGTWLNTLTLRTGWDIGAGAYAEQLSPTLPAEAMHWAESISDEAVRTRQVEGVASVWTISDPWAAQAWYANAHLTNEARQEISRVFRRSP